MVFEGKGNYPVDTYKYIGTVDRKQNNRVAFLNHLSSVHNFLYLQSHHQPSGAGEGQGGYPSQGRASRGDSARVLQLRLSQCLPPRLHPSQG